MDPTWTYAVKPWLLPPGANLLLLGLAWLLRRRARRLAAVAATVAIATLAACSLPAVASWLAGPLERAAALAAAGHDPRTAEAVVVLAAGRRERAPEYGGRDTVDALTLERLRHGARLARRYRLPVLVTGGVVLDGGPPLAELMAAVLTGELGVPVRWRESRARNTRENALYAARLLVADGVRRVLLVTHALHMPRALDSFADTPLTVIAAPTAFATTGRPGGRWYDWVPSAGALALSRDALHEYLGRVWYRLRYR